MSITTPEAIILITVFGYIFDDDGTTPIVGGTVTFSTGEAIHLNDNLYSIFEQVTTDSAGRYQAVLPSTADVGQVIDVQMKWTDSDGKKHERLEKIITNTTTPISVQDALAVVTPTKVITGGPQGVTGPQGATGAAGSLTIVSVANAANPTELNATNETVDGTAVYAIQTVVGGEDVSTVYIFDANPGAAVNAPYVMATSDGGTTRWRAVGGRYIDQSIDTTGLINTRDLAVDGTKLDTIETNATADQTDAEIKTAYENNADTNAFTDAEQTKLGGIEALATADQSDAEIKTAYLNNSDTNNFDDDAKSNLEVTTQMLTTGWRGDAPEFTVNGGDPNLVDHTSGIMELMDHSTFPPGITLHTLAANTGLTPTNILTNSTTHYSYNGTILIGGTVELTNTQRRSHAAIAIISHAVPGTIDDIIPKPTTTVSVAAQVHDHIKSFGFRSTKGNSISGVPGFLEVTKEAGFANELEGGEGNLDDPHKVSLPQQVSASMFHITQSLVIDHVGSTLDPTIYDNAGVVTTVPANNNTTVSRIYIFSSGAMVLMMGQEIFANFSDGKDAALAGSESFVETQDIADNGLFLGRVVMQKNVTDSADTSKFLIVRPSGVSGGGGSLTSLAQAYQISAEPEIPLDAIRGALSLLMYSGGNATNAFEILNDLSAITFKVTGAGDVTANTFNGVDVAALQAGLTHKPSVDTSTRDVGNITLSGEQTINGLLTSTSEVIVVEQTLGEENGVYDTAAGAWTRRITEDAPDELFNGAHWEVVNSGSSKDRFHYTLTTTGAIVIGTTPLTFNESPHYNFGTVGGTIAEGNDSRIVASSTHNSSDGKDHSDVVLNNTHRTSDGKNHSDVVLNNTHRTSDGSGHSDVAINTTHISSDGSDHGHINQDVQTTASPTFVGGTFTGNLEVQGQVYSTEPAISEPTGTTQTIDWDNGNAQTLDLGSATGNVTLTLSNPSSGGSYQLRIRQGATARTVILPSSVRLPGGISGPHTLVISTSNNDIDVLTLTFHGSNYFASFAQDFE